MNFVDTTTTHCLYKVLTTTLMVLIGNCDDKNVDDDRQLQYKFSDIQHFFIALY